MDTVYPFQGGKLCILNILFSEEKRQQNSVTIIIRCVKKEKKGIIYIRLKIYGIFLQGCWRDNSAKNGCPPGRKTLARNTGGRDFLSTLYPLERVLHAGSN